MPSIPVVAARARRMLLVASMKRDDENGIDERSFRFFRDVLAFVETIPVGPRTNKIIEQLVGSAGSIGANREEALGGSSRDEFIRFNEISLRGANESVRWLRACATKNLGSQKQCLALLNEGRQLARILGKIVVTSKRRAGTLPRPRT
jgi:four helix bundle protein